MIQTTKTSHHQCNKAIILKIVEKYPWSTQWSPPINPKIGLCPHGGPVDLSIVSVIDRKIVVLQYKIKKVYDKWIMSSFRVHLFVKVIGGGKNTHLVLSYGVGRVYIQSNQQSTLRYWCRFQLLYQVGGVSYKILPVRQTVADNNLHIN